MRRLLSVLAVVAAGLVPVSITPAPALADTVLRDHHALPISSLADRVTDLAGGRIYLSPGHGDERVVVTDLAGQPVATVGGLTGAGPLALSADGGSLFVALETGQIVQLDTETLAQVASFPIADNVRVDDLAWAGGKLWVLRTTWYGDPVLASLDPGSRADTPTDLDVRGSTLAPTPDGGRVLVLGGGPTELLAIDASGSVAASRQFPYAVQGVETSVTGQVHVTMDYPESRLVLLDPETLETVRSTLTAPHLATTDGTLVVGGAGYWLPRSVRVLDAATSEELNQFQVPFDQAVDDLRVVDALLTRQGLLLIADSSGPLTTWYVADPTAPTSELTLDVPDGAWIGKETIVAGTLTDGGSPIAGAQVTITDFPGITHSLPDRTRTVTTAADGSFSFPYTPRAWREVFEVEYVGDAEHLGATEEFAGVFEHQPTILDVNRPDGVGPGEPVTFEGSLTALDEPVADAPIEVRRYCDGAQDPVELRTDDEGLFRMTVVPGRCADPSFQFSYDDDSWTYESAYASRFVTVAWDPASISLVQPVESAVVGSTFTWTGALSVAGAAAPGVPLTWTLAREYAGGAVASGELQTDSSGAFRIELPVEQADRYTMTVRFAGDETTLATSASDAFQTSRIPTRVTVDAADIQALPDDEVTITGRVTTADGVAVASLPLEVWHDGQVVAPLVTDADGHFDFVTVPRPPQSWSDDGKRYYSVHVVQDSRYAESYAPVRVTVAPQPTRLVLDGMPSPTGPGDVVTLGGHLTTVDGAPLAGRSVELTHQDGETRRYLVTTDDDGRFGVSTVIQTGHWQQLTAAFAGTRLLASTSETQSWKSEPLPGLLTLEPVPTRVLGETVKIRGRLTDAEGHGESSWLTVKRITESGQTAWTYDPFQTASDGTFSLEVPAEEVGRFTYLVRSSVWRVAQQTGSITVDVRRLQLSTAAQAPAASRNGWAIYDARQDPRLLTKTTPARAGLCVAHEIERRVDGAWRPLATSPCVDTDDAGAVRHRLTLRHPEGSRFRVRAVRDAAIRTEGAWTMVRFR